MKYLIQFSGGVGSFASAVKCCSLYGKENVELIFADTKTEDEDLYRFVDECVAYLGVPIHRLADGRDVWQVFFDKRFLGNSRVDPCSRILKRELCKTFVEKNYKVDEACVVVGVDWTEAHRVKNFSRWWLPYASVAPLVEDLSFDKHRFMDWMESQGIRRPRLYDMGFQHNNCGGFCIKAGKAHFLRLLETMPERYAYHEGKEQELREFLGKPYTILREQVNGERRYLTLRQLRERAEEIKETEDGQLDWGGCGCFSDIPAEEMAV